MAAKIYSSARERLLEIWDYTESTWNADQADKYVRGLVQAINEAHGERQSWRRVTDNALKGVFFIRHRHHYIFFRTLSKGTLGVISILHEKMDIPSRLKEDAARDESE
jgi:toxin ParE1/3/4